MKLAVVQSVLVLVSAVTGTARGEPYRNRFSSPVRQSSQSVSFQDDEFNGSNKLDGIPIFMAEALSKAKNLRDLERLVDHPSRLRYDVRNMARSAVPAEGLSTRFGGVSQVTSSGNKNGEMAVAAVCKPSLTTVPIADENKKSNTIYWPSCTRVERCGGCCSHELLSCKPTATNTLHVQVVSMGYQGGSSSMGYTGTLMVPLEVHTACECGCKLTEDDCNQFQEYAASECRCKCVNKEDYIKCSKDSLKLWEPSTCRCKCKQQRECSTGHYFDLNTCSCPNLPTHRAGPRATEEQSLRRARPQGATAGLNRAYTTYTTRPNWDDLVETVRPTDTSRPSWGALTKTELPVYTTPHHWGDLVETVYSEDDDDDDGEEE